MKSTESLLKIVIKKEPIRDEQLITTLTGIQETTNSRSLTSTSDGINDFTAFTPNHFLYGRSLNLQGADQNNSKNYCVKSIQIWSFFLVHIFPHSDWIRELALFYSRAFFSLIFLARVIEVREPKNGLIRSLRFKLKDTALVHSVYSTDKLLEKTSWIRPINFSLGVEQCHGWHSRLYGHK